MASRASHLAAAFRGRARTLVLATGAMSAAVIVATLCFEGAEFVNLDSLTHQAWRFYALLVCPASLVTVCLVTAALPRVVAINLAVLGCLVLMAEAGAWVLAPVRPAIGGEPEAKGASLYVRDAALGYVMTPSTVARHRRRVGGAQIYDVTYHTDALGRRETPTSPGSPRTSFLLFFGDSNMFGEGLSDTETLPYYVGEQARGFRPYNYGVSGYGPAHLLTLASSGRVGHAVLEPDGYAVFFFIPAHVGRVVGSSIVSTGWGRHFPYYEMNARGAVVSRGDFVHGRPLITLAYFFWTRSNLAAYFDADLPLRYTESDYRLTARILKESSLVLSEQLELRGFVVVLGQAYNEPQRRVIRAFREALVREGVRHLDYTRLFDARDVRYRLSELDYHNSAEANRIIAARLVADLGISR